MNTLLITPLSDEFVPLLNAFHALGCSTVLRTIGNLSVAEIEALGLILAQGGHGKTQFGIQTQHLLDQVADIALVICAGAAGGLAHSVKIGDLVVATATIEHDFNNKFVIRPQPSFEGSLPHLQRIQALSPLPTSYTIHFGKVASGDEDIIDRARARELEQFTGALAVAWEGAGGARAAAFMKVPYLEIRGLTDIADNDAPVIFDENVKIIMPRIAALVAKLTSPPAPLRFGEGCL
jgi:adenosylhomocysteine nucleosidase